MLRFWASVALMCATALTYGASSYADPAVGSAGEVLQWNKALLTIVRTPGSQPATVHPTRSFAIMQAAVYDAVNAIDATHKPYLVRVEHVSAHVSQEAAGVAAADETLITLYPAFQTTLDQQYDHSLVQVPDALGFANSTVATADQKLIGRFWNGAIQNYWNEITHTAVQAHPLTTAESARVFALLNLTLADEVISFYDAKYTYDSWRPVTAIRAAATVDNNQTAADPNWLPQAGNTAADPSYPCAHATISAGAAFVPSAVFVNKPFPLGVTSEVLPGGIRYFDSFAVVEKEASLSRVYAGQHFRSDENAGERLGSAAADFVVDNFLTLVGDGDGY